MNWSATTRSIAFAGTRRIASGELLDVALKVKDLLTVDPQAAVLIFETATSETIELDFRGSRTDVRKRVTALPSVVTVTVTATAVSDENASQEQQRGPGRPKLGVVAREITLLPRHWDWLAEQRGGASVTLRRLVDEARLSGRGKQAKRRAQEITYRFMSAMAGNQSGFEEATRALFADDMPRFDQEVQAWPADIRNHAKKLAAAAMQASASTQQQDTP